MTPALPMTRPVRARFPVASLWLLVLLPGVLVALQGEVQLARSVPSLVVLTVVALAERGRTALAVRLRKEARLILPFGVALLGASALPQLEPLIDFGPARLLVGFMPWVLASVLVASVLLQPLVREVECGTLGALLLSPGGGRALVEKYALSALVVVASWAQLSASNAATTELWWFGLGGHLLPLATVPTWFFLTRNEGAALGLVMLAPFAAVAAPGLLGADLRVLVGVLALYAAAVLSALPAAVRRGVHAPALGEGADVPGLASLERRGSPLVRAAVREQRESVLFMGLLVVVTSVVWLLDGRDEAAMLAFGLAACTAALSAGLAFAEPRRLGVLELELAARPRREVFRRRALTALLVTGLGALVVPGVVLAALGGFAPSSAPGWALAMLVVWSCSLAFATTGRAVGTALVGGLGLAFLVFVMNFAFVLGAAWLVDVTPSEVDGRLLWAALAVSAVLALVGARWRFVEQPQAGWRAWSVIAVAQLVSSTLFGLASALR